MLLFHDSATTLNLVSGLLESISEVESRFVRIVDKECESASNELKKWFKKLAVSNCNICNCHHTPTYTPSERGEGAR